MIVDIDTKRSRPKIWFPCRLDKLKDNINGDGFGSNAGPYSMGTATDPTSFDSPSSSDSVNENGGQEAEEDSFEPPSMPSFFIS